MRYYIWNNVVLILLCLICFTPRSAAQFKSVTIGIDGLTCSSCSFGVEQSVRKLDFVKDVKPDLNAATATISFQTDKKISIDDLVKKVYQAGFSVRFVKAVYYFHQPVIPANDTLIIDKDVFYFLNPPSSSLKDDVTLQLIGEKYVAKKIFKHWEPQLQQARRKYPQLPPDIYFVLL
jgi:copper chaperone CopZ